MSTLHLLYEAVRDADPRTYANQWEDIAAKIGMDPNGSEFEQLVRASKVSGYLREREGALTIGPTALPAASGRGTVPARRPRPDATTPHKDRLRLARRARQWDDEAFTGSDYVNDGEGGYLCAAGVTKAGRPTVRVGLPCDGKTSWTAEQDDGETVQLDDAGVAALERGVDEVIAAGEAAAVPYRAAERRLDLAGDRLKHAEGPRVGAQAAEDAFYASLAIKDDLRLKKLWSDEADIGGYADALDADARAQYDEQEARYQAFSERKGSEEDVHAAGDERRDARARQMALLYPSLTVGEASEFLRISEVDWRTRSREQSQRSGELLDKMGLQRTYKSGGPEARLSGMLSVYGKDRDIDRNQALIERVEAGARPVSEKQRAEIDAAWSEIHQAQAAYDALAGHDIHTVAVPGQWGDLVLQVTQGEEGDGHRYRVDIRPDGAGTDWSPGSNGDAWAPKPAALRKLAAMVREQYDQSKPPGWRHPPSGVPPT